MTSLGRRIRPVCDKVIQTSFFCFFFLVNHWIINKFIMHVNDWVFCTPRPVWNQGLLESPLNKKTWFWPQYSVFFFDFRSRCPVTSGDVISPPSHARDLGISFGGSCLLSRFYPAPRFFESTATHAGGLGRSLTFRRAQTYSVTSTAKGLEFTQANPFQRSDWSKWVTWTNWWRIPC